MADAKKREYLACGFPPHFTQDFFQSHWQVTQRCNFHCPYCVNEDLRRDGIHMPREILLTALEYMAALRHASFRFAISGGEVTLYPHLEEMLSFIAANFPAGSHVNMLTNGSSSVARLRRLLAAAPGLQCRFIITIHLGQTRVAELAQKLLDFSGMERKQHFHVKLMVPPADPRAAEARAILDEAGIAHTRHAVIDFAAGKLAEGYTPEELEALACQERTPWFHYRHLTAAGEEDVSFLEGVRRDMFHYTGMYCSAGPQSIYLDEYGHVARGQFCGRMPYTILEQNPFADPAFMTPAPCREQHCTCMSYTALPKWRDAAHAPAPLARERCA